MKLKIDKHVAQMLQKFRTKESMRIALSYIGVSDGYIYATDGRRCIRFKMNEPIKDGTYRMFIDGDAYLFEEELLFPNAKAIYPKEEELVQICKIDPHGSLSNAIIDIFTKTNRAINNSYIQDIALRNSEYWLFVKKGEENSDDKLIFLKGGLSNKFFGEAEIIMLPYKRS